MQPDFVALPTILPPGHISVLLEFLYPYGKSMEFPDAEH